LTPADATRGKSTEKNKREGNSSLEERKSLAKKNAKKSERESADAKKKGGDAQIKPSEIGGKEKRERNGEEHSEIM